jgi:hypothetical protein
VKLLFFLTFSSYFVIIRTRDDQSLNSKASNKYNAGLSFIDKYTPALPKLPNVNVISTLYSRRISVINEPKTPTVSSTFSSSVLRNASNNITKQSSLLSSTNTSANVENRATAEREIIEIDITNTSTNATTNAQVSKKAPQKRPSTQNTLDENDFDDTRIESMPTSGKSFLSSYYNNKAKVTTATNWTLNEVDKHLSRSDEIREEM